MLHHFGWLCSVHLDLEIPVFRDKIASETNPDANAAHRHHHIGSIPNPPGTGRVGPSATHRTVCEFGKKQGYEHSGAKDHGWRERDLDVVSSPTVAFSSHLIISKSPRCDTNAIRSNSCPVVDTKFESTVATS